MVATRLVLLVYSSLSDGPVTTLQIPKSASHSVFTMQLDQNSKNRLATAIVCTVIVISSVLLRLWCKLKFLSSLHLEDWLMLAVMFAYLGATAVDIWGTLISLRQIRITHH